MMMNDEFFLTKKGVRKLYDEYDGNLTRMNLNSINREVKKSLDAKNIPPVTITNIIKKIPPDDILETYKEEIHSDGTVTINHDIIDGLMKQKGEIKMDDKDYKKLKEHVKKLTEDNEEYDAVKSVVGVNIINDSAADYNTMQLKYFLENLFDEIGMFNKLSLKLPKTSGKDLLKILNKSELLDKDLNINLTTIGDEIMITILNKKK